MQYKTRIKIIRFKKRLKRLIPSRKSICIGIIVLLVVLSAFMGVSCSRIFNKKIVVENTSMEPTLKINDVVRVNKAAYAFSKPDRGDVVYISVGPEGKERYYIRRVVGLPGDMVEIFDGILYINDEETDIYGYIEYEGVAAGGVALGDDEYFVMGDNYNDCEDSRNVSFGFIKKNRILGEIKD